jgi:hypothetical protein
VQEKVALDAGQAYMHQHSSMLHAYLSEYPARCNVLSMMDGRGRVRCPVFYFTRKPLHRPLVASRVFTMQGN